MRAFRAFLSLQCKLRQSRLRDTIICVDETVRAGETSTCIPVLAASSRHCTSECASEVVQSAIGSLQAEPQKRPARAHGNFPCGRIDLSRTGGVRESEVTCCIIGSYCRSFRPIIVQYSIWNRTHGWVYNLDTFSNVRSESSPLER